MTADLPNNQFNIGKIEGEGKESKGILIKFHF